MVRRKRRREAKDIEQNVQYLLSGGNEKMCCNNCGSFDPYYVKIGKYLWYE